MNKNEVKNACKRKKRRSEFLMLIIFMNSGDLTN